MDVVIGLKAVTCSQCRTRKGHPTGRLVMVRKHGTRLAADIICQHCGHSWQSVTPRIVQAAAKRAWLQRIPISEGRAA